jgi:hypothetical protein
VCTSGRKGGGAGGCLHVTVRDLGWL